MTDASDDTLMQAVRHGNHAALDTLFARHHGRLFSFLARCTRDRDLADDLTQETFLRVLAARHQYRGGAFLPWLFRIARNLLADRYRAARPQVALEDAPDLATPAPTPIDRIVDDEEHRQLDRALAQLDPADREILLLRGTERCSHREIAAILETTEGNARVRVHRALKALRAIWLRQHGEVTR